MVEENKPGEEHAMNMPRRLVLFVSLLTVLLGACTRNDKNPIGTDLPDDDWYGNGPFVDTLFVEDEMTARLFESAGASPFLLVGEHEGLISRAVVKASILPAADSVLTASLELRVYELQGAGQITISVFPMTEPGWEEAEASWDLASGTELEDPVEWAAPGGDYDASTLLGQTVVTESLTDSTLVLELDPSIVTAWMDSTVENSGLMLIAEGEGMSPGLVAFRSRQSANVSGEDYLGPQLFLQYTKQDDPDSTVEGRISITEDVTLYRYDGEPPSGLLRVGSVPQYRSYLSFDMSIYDASTSIRHATLVLPVSDRLPPEGGLVAGVFKITGDWDEGETPLEFTTLDSVEVGDDDEVRLQITDMAWGWVSGVIENHGIAVKATVERGKFRFVDFEGSGQGPMTGPRCIVEYTTPPTETPVKPDRVETHD